MIKFFRHVRKRLLLEGNSGKYLKYAFGEIVLVVIGILIALQVNNWNENRKNKQVATELKSRLINDFNADIKNINRRIVFFEKILDFGNRVEEELNQQKASNFEDQWQFIVNVFHTSQIWKFTPTNTTYNEIQNSNLLGFIGSSDLSNELSVYYNNMPVQLDEISGGTAVYRDYVRSIIPMQVQEYIWKHCYDGTELGTQLILECNAPDMDPKIIETLYRSVIENPNFMMLHTRRLSTIYVRNAIHISYIRLGESIIKNIQSPD